MENNEEGAKTPATDTPAPEPKFDYEGEYKKLQIELEKQKKLKDDYAKESAGYKKQLTEKMTEDEKNAQAQQEIAEKLAQLEAENKTYKLEKEILGEGFTTDECKKLIDSNFGSKAIMEIIKNRIEENTKSVKASLIKETTPSDPVGNGTTNAQKGKSEFAKYQEEVFNKKATTKVEF